MLDGTYQILAAAIRFAKPEDVCTVIQMNHENCCERGAQQENKLTNLHS